MIVVKFKQIFSLFKENVKAGLAVSLVSIPLAISLAVASNTVPIVGIITAVWAGLAASIFGGSNYNVVGPTGALTGILALYAITFGPEALATLAIFAGIFICIAYFLKLDKYLVLFPSCTFQGFILGVSVIIILNQINLALGITNSVVHNSLLGNTLESFYNIGNLSIASTVLFIVVLFLLFLFAKIMVSIPAIIIVAPVSILIGYLSANKIVPFMVQTIGSKYPDFHITFFLNTSLAFNSRLLVPSCVIALIAIIETMISARIADGITKTKHNKKREILGLGLANIISGLAGGMPATAALARTDLNIRAGATNKISAGLCSIFITLIVFIFIDCFKYLPMPAIAAILTFVAINMIEKKRIIRIYKVDKKNFLLVLLIAAVSVYEDPIIGLLLGATIAMLLFMFKLSEAQFKLVVKDQEGHIKLKSTETDIKDSDLLVYHFKGQLAYINVQSYIARFENRPAKYHNVLLDLKDVYFIDLDGVDAFSNIINIVHSRGKRVFISGINQLNEKLLENSNEFNLLKQKGFIFSSVLQVIEFLKTK